MEPTLAFDNNGFDNSDVTIQGGGGRFFKGIVRRGAHRQLGPLARILIPGSIMLIELFERMTYYSILSGIVFLSVRNWDYNIHTGAINLLAAFAGGEYLAAPFGGIIADAFLGRFYTILASTIIYIAGLATFISASFDTSQLDMDDFDVATRRNMGMAGIVLIFIGAGGIKANIPPFGADQIRPLGERAVTFYFNWYYLFINIGSALASLVVYHLQTEKYLGAGLLIPLCGMAVSLLVFAAMYSQYVSFKPERETVMGTCGIFRQGCCKGKPDVNNKLPEGAERTLFANAMESFGGDKPDHVVFGFASFFKTILIAMLIVGAWYGIAVFYVAMPFQSEHMNRNVGSSKIAVWVARSFFHLALLFAALIATFCVLPLFRLTPINLTPLKRIGIGNVLVVLGLIVSGSVEVARKDVISDGKFSVQTHPPSPALLSYMMSEEANKTREAFFAQAAKAPGFQPAMMPALIEQSNQYIVLQNLLLNTPDGFPLWEMAQPWNVSDVNMLWQIPQFILIGAGEAFVGVAGLEIAYQQAPFAYQGLLTGIFVMARGMGSMTSSSLITFIDQWTETCNHLGLCAGKWFSSGADINDTNVEYLLFTSASIVAFFFICFIFITYRYRYSDPMSFGELEESDIPGMEIKMTPLEDQSRTSNNYIA